MIAAPSPRDPTAEELAAYAESNRIRIERMNRVGFLSGSLRPDELAGLIVLLEAAVAERRPLPGLTRGEADEAMAYLLPHEAW